MRKGEEAGGKEKKRRDEIMGRGRRAEGEMRAEREERRRGGGGWRRRGGFVMLRMVVVEVVCACASRMNVCVCARVRPFVCVGV